MRQAVIEDVPLAICVGDAQARLAFKLEPRCFRHIRNWLNCLGSRELPETGHLASGLLEVRKDSSLGHLYFNNSFAGTAPWPSYSDFMDEVKL